MKSLSLQWARSPDHGLVVATSVAVLVMALPCFAQGNGGSSSPPVLHPFVFGVADGDSTASETSVYDVRIPIAFTLIEPTDERWGLRLRLVVYAGVYDFTVDEATDLQIEFQSIAGTPGVEFLFPVGKVWLIKPFAEFGYGRDLDNDIDYGVWSVGMRTVATWPVKKFDLSFGAKVQYRSTFTSDLAFADDFGEVRLGFDARHPVPFTVGASQGNVSFYFIRRQYVDAFIARDELEPLEIRHSNEFGLTFGTTPAIDLWFFKLPRVGLGFRWGPNVRGVRLNFGFPF